MEKMPRVRGVGRGAVSMPSPDTLHPPYLSPYMFTTPESLSLSLILFAFYKAYYIGIID